MALLDSHIEGKYEILEKIREGGMGAVYKVRHRLLDEVRVVKVIRPQHAGAGACASERFLREAKAAIRLRHPNVATLHDFAVAPDGNAFIVLEYIAGWSLLDLLQGYGPPPLPLTLEIARQSLKALGYLHRHRIVHRDVSPDNLMLTRDVEGQPLVKLIDLGIAKALEEESSGLTTHGVFLGKPRYAAPEQFTAEGPGERSDLYSFAVVLYELLTGQPPVRGRDPASYMAGHLFQPPLPFEESDPAGAVPADLRALVLRALAKNPAERPLDATAFARALGEVQNRFPLTAADLDAVLGVLLPLGTPAPPAAPAEPGSTQDRLDREFLATAAPEPQPPAPPELRVIRGGETVATAATIAAADTLALRPAGDARDWADETFVLPSRAGRADRLAGGDLALRPGGAVAGSAGDGAASPAAEPAARGGTSRLALVAGGTAALALAAGLWFLTGRTAEPAAGPGRAAPAGSAAASLPPPADPAGSLPAGPPSDAHPVAAPRGPAPPAGGVPSASGSPGEPAAAAAIPTPAAPSATPRPARPAPVSFPEEAAEGLLRPGPDVSPPVPLDIPAYAYPEAARGSGRQVSVRLALLVDESGAVVDARVREGGPAGLGFDEAALAAGRRTRFQPAYQGDLPGRMWTDLILDFSE